MANQRRQFRSETVTPQVTNRFIIPKTFDPMEDSNVVTGATSQPATQPITPVTPAIKTGGGKPDAKDKSNNTSTADKNANNTGLSSDISAGEIGAGLGTLGSAISGVPGLGIVGAAIGAAVGVSQAEKDLESIGIDADLSFGPAFGAALTGGFLGSTGVEQARRARATGIANVAKSASIQGAKTAADKQAVADAAKAERTKRKSLRDKKQAMQEREAQSKRSKAAAEAQKAKSTPAGVHGPSPTGTDAAGAGGVSAGGQTSGGNVGGPDRGPGGGKRR